MENCLVFECSIPKEIKNHDVVESEAPLAMAGGLLVVSNLCNFPIFFLKCLIFFSIFEFLSCYFHRVFVSNWLPALMAPVSWFNQFLSWVKKKKKTIIIASNGKK